MERADQQSAAAEDLSSGQIDGGHERRDCAATEDHHVRVANAPVVTAEARALPTADGAAHMFVFTAQKAGMKDVDKEHVQKVVYEMSKDSLFFQNSIKQNEKVEARISEMKAKLEALSSARRETLGRQVQRLTASLEANRELNRTKVVIDMDMFYAAVEMRDNPSLRDKPLAVGGIGMLSTTNYVARKFGVRAAMPGFIGKELCPDLVIVPTNFEKYTAISKQIQEIVSHYDPDFRAMSLDEVYCDITDYMEDHWPRYSISHGHTANSSEEEKDDNGDISRSDYSGDDGSVGGEVASSTTFVKRRKHKVTSVPQTQREAIAAAIVNEIRQKIFDATQLTASAGIAANTMLAKICSDVNKPNGQYVLPFTREDIVSFVDKLPVRKIGGIGKVMEKTLNSSLGITTGKELHEKKVELFHLFSQRTATWLLRVSLGIQGESSGGKARERKGYSRERTFSAKGISDPRWLEKICRELCDRLASDLQRGAHGAKTVTLKLKCVDFSLRTRATTSARTLRTGDDFFTNALELLRKEMPLNLRLMGVRASALVRLGPTSSSDRADSTESLKRQSVIESFAKGADSGASLLDPFEEFELLHQVRSADEDAASSSGESGPARTKRGHKRQLDIQHFADRVAASDPFSKPMRSHQLPKRVASSSGAMLLTTVSTSLEVGLPDTGFQPCPVCGKTINASNAIAIEVHVDACLRNSERASSRHQQQRTMRQFFRR